MAKMADGKAVTHEVKLFGEKCQVTVFQTSKTVFVAQGDYKGAAIEAKAANRAAALERWRSLAERSED